MGFDLGTHSLRSEASLVELDKRRGEDIAMHHYIWLKQTFLEENACMD